MDKGVQEGIINILTGAVTYNMSYPKGLTWLKCAEEIDKVYKKLGYHKLPKDKPPLLNDGEILRALDRLIKSPEIVKKPERAIAYAQREADIKHYEQ